MLRYALSRCASLVISLIVASMVIFLTIEIVPGDPAAFMLGLNAQPEAVEALRTQLGLNASALERYFKWVSGMLQGDFGTSYTYRAPVSDLIADRIWVSLPLAVYALVLSTLIAFPAGIFTASRRGGAGDPGESESADRGVSRTRDTFRLLGQAKKSEKQAWERNTYCIC